MITYASSDIIRQAKVVANVSNVNIGNFELATTLLNTEYQRLYDKIVMANGAHIKEEHFVTDQPYDIPEDCYHIIGVYAGKRLLTKSSIKQHIKGTYRIENNKIILENVSNDDIYIKYSTLPQTLTAPDTPEEINADVKEVGLVTDKGFYFKNSEDTELFYDFSAQESIEKPFKAASNRFLDSTLEFADNTVTYNGTDVTHIFSRDDVDIETIRISDPYVIVNYSDKRSFIFYGFEGADKLNWNEAKGKETYGEVLGFTTNDITGKGCIWKDEEENIYYTSFTPDTLLNYPSNTFFQLLIYKLAAALTALNGVQNQYLIEVQIAEAEVAFEEHLAKDNLSVGRMNNDLW
jgi:hypothetical protein